MAQVEMINDILQGIRKELNVCCYQDGQSELANEMIK